MDLEEIVNFGVRSLAAFGTGFFGEKELTQVEAMFGF